MLDRLPVELVQHIVRLTLPSPSHATYRERQDRLLVLCRTSRALRTVGQTVLFEVVELASREQFSSFLEAVKANELSERVRSVQLYEDPYGRNMFQLAAGDYASLVRRCPRLAELRIAHSRVDLAELQEATYLQRLIISRGTAYVSRPFVLPQVEELSLLGIGNLEDFLPTHSFPSLSAFHIEMADFGEFKPEQLLSLLPHLDAFSIDFRDVLCSATGPARTLASSPRVLFDLTPHSIEGLLEDFEAVLAAARALRLKAGAAALSNYADLTPALNCLVANLARLTGLQHLVLPTECLWCKGWNVDYHRALADLRAACQARGIDVVFEPQGDFEYDSLVSPEFWRRCKALKAKEEDETKGKEQQ
ncbi:hypothetical protein JCM10213_003788 [Rhodosporidiobolus nylandii]